MSWLSLELNIICFIPLICLRFYHDSPMIKYFLIQVTGTLLFIMFFLIDYFVRDLIQFSSYARLVIIISISIKIGIPPFHSWFPQLIERLNELHAGYLMIIQKIIPILFISFSFFNLYLLMILWGGVVGSLGGINQNSVKKIIAYSSIVHGSWIILCIINSLSSFLEYYLIYSLISFTLLIFVKKIQLKKVNYFSINNINPINKLIFFVVILSLAGLPPFAGFYLKLMVITSSVPRIRLTWIIIVLIICSVISLLFYLRMFYSITILSSVIQKKNVSKHHFFRIIFPLVVFINIVSPLGLAFV